MTHYDRSLATVPDEPSVPKNTALAARTADALARVHTANAIAILAGIMEDAEKDADRVHAAKEILDRGWGKPLTATITLPASRKLASQLYAMEEDELLTVIRDDKEPSFAKGGCEDAELDAISFEDALATLPSLYDAPSIEDDPLLR